MVSFSLLEVSNKAILYHLLFAISHELDPKDMSCFSKVFYIKTRGESESRIVFMKIIMEDKSLISIL